MLAESIWIFKSGSCLTNVVAFFREINKIVDKGIMVDLTYLVISFKESKKSEDKRKRQKSASPFSADADQNWSWCLGCLVLNSMLAWRISFLFLSIL